MQLEDTCVLLSLHWLQGEEENNFKVLEAYVAISKRTCSVNGTGYQSSKVAVQYVNSRFVLHLRSCTSLGAYALRQTCSSLQRSAEIFQAFVKVCFSSYGPKSSLVSFFSCSCTFTFFAQVPIHPSQKGLPSSVPTDS